MGTTSVKLFTLFLFLVFNSRRGSAQCTVNSIIVNQSPTGKQVNGAAEYEVSLSNGCVCNQSDLLVACLEFKSTEPVEESTLRPISGRECLVNDGKPLAPGDMVVFDYASRTQYTFNPTTSNISC